MSLAKRPGNACLTLLTITIVLKVTTDMYYRNELCPFLVCTQVKHSLTSLLKLNEDSEPNVHYHKGRAEKLDFSNLYRYLSFHVTLSG